MSDSPPVFSSPWEPFRQGLTPEEHAEGDPYLFHYVLRFEARRRAVVALNRRIRESGNPLEWSGLTLASIDREAIVYAMTEWRRHYGPKTHYGFQSTWDELYFRYSPRPSHFGVAVWRSNGAERVLLALGIGRANTAKTLVSLDYVEKSFAPEHCPRGVLLPILTCLEEYARLLKAMGTIIDSPVDPGQFTKYGYGPPRPPVKRGAYLFKELPR